MNMRNGESTKPNILPDGAFNSLVALGGVLRGIHKRLISEGYIVKDGRVVKK